MNETPHNKRRIRKIVFWIITILLLLLVVLGVTGYNFYNTSLKPLDPEQIETEEIEIPMGSSRSDIARILEKENIIKSASAFNMYIRLNNEQGFQAGYYEFSPSMSTDQIISKLKEGGKPVAKEAVSWIPLPEGITLKQISKIIAKNTDFEQAEIETKLDSQEFINEMANKYPELLTVTAESEETIHPLEGYLFPATYEYHSGMTLENVLEDMIKKTNHIMKPLYNEIKKQQTTPHKVLTLASYIEREGIEYEDRRKIAGVFYNRIEKGMPLQTDVSVTYALGEHKERITNADLEIDSPYNTYKYKGIGPGPVNNPSESSIKAVLDPEDTNYYYFLADLKTKKVYFSENYKQHLEYKAKYLDGK